jgi:hypothetical protein
MSGREPTFCCSKDGLGTGGMAASCSAFVAERYGPLNRCEQQAGPSTALPADAGSFAQDDSFGVGF